MPRMEMEVLSEKGTEKTREKRVRNYCFEKKAMIFLTGCKHYLRPPVKNALNSLSSGTSPYTSFEWA